MEYVIGVPLLEDELESNKEFKKQKEIAEFIHNHPGCTRRFISDGVTGSKEIVGERLADLIAGGWVENRGNDRSFILYISDSGKSHFNLMEAEITQLMVN
jgi:hypothetical protein